MRFGALFAFAAASCATPIQPGPAVDLTGNWRVAAINTHATPRTGNYAAQFASGGFSAYFGCNRFAGDYQLDRDSMTVGPFHSTQAGCPEPAMTFEGWAFSVIRQPMRMSWQSDQRVTLSNAAGSIMLERKQPVPVLAGTTWRVLSINGVPPPTGGAIRFTPNWYDANFGCNDVDGGYRQEGDRFEVLISRQTEKECLSVAPSGLSVSTFEEWGARILWSKGVTISTAGPGLMRLESPRGAILLQRVQ